MKSKTNIIIAREFSERVKKKSFIITTLLFPVLMILMSLTPALIMMLSEPETKEIAVIDDSGFIADKLKSNETVKFFAALEPADSAYNPNIFGTLIINRNVIKNPKSIKLMTNEASNMELVENITRQITKIIEDEKLKQYNIENLDQILDDVKTNVVIQTYRTDGETDETESDSVIIAFIISMLLAFILYMILLLYGGMVMNSIVEEKANRVLEVMVTSVKPFQLMMGKIIGVGLVAVVQIIIWGVLVSSITGILMPMLLPEDIAAQAAAFSSGNIAGIDTSTVDVEMLQAVSILGNVGYIIKIFALLLLFMVGGYLFYAAIFAAIGSAIDNVQDGSQLQSIAVFPIIIAFILSLSVANDPNSPLAFWSSMIPFFSPIVMLTRIPFGIPTWEIVVSLVVLVVSFCTMTWVAAKIYRVGIFMYGKKPSFKEMIKWITYK